MALDLSCPGCGRQLRIPDGFLGKQVRCPTCRTVFTGSPGPNPAEPPAAAEGPAAPEVPDPSASEAPSAVKSSAPPLPAPPIPPPDAEDEPEEDEEDDQRPWEGPYGGVRRDCEPHRGPMVLTLGIISTVCGAMSVVGWLCCGLAVLLSLPGLPLGIVAWVMGSRDLRQMREGTKHPEGQGQTQAGRICGIIGTITSALGLLVTVLLIVGYVLFFAVLATTTPASVPARPTPVPVVPNAPPGK
jgi:LSD1 subclass zinc finger protein